MFFFPSVMTLNPTYNPKARRSYPPGLTQFCIKPSNVRFFMKIPSKYLDKGIQVHAPFSIAAFFDTICGGFNEHEENKLLKELLTNRNNDLEGNMFFFSIVH